MSNIQRDGRSLRAARWALSEGKSLSDAARKFELQVDTVGQTWHRMFPDVPALVSRRRGSQIRGWPEDECSL